MRLPDDQRVSSVIPESLLQRCLPKVGLGLLLALPPASEAWYSMNEILPCVLVPNLDIPHVQMIEHFLWQIAMLPLEA